MNTKAVNVLKYCSRCGSEHTTYRSNDSIFCEKCGFQFFVNSVSAVAVIIKDEEDNILLTVRGQNPGKNMLDLPGGFVDIGETAEQAVKREIKEELGLTVQTMSYLGSYPNEYVYSGLTIHTLDLAFECTVAHYERVKVADDVSDYVFVSRKKMDLEKIAFTSIQKIIKDYIEI